MDIDDFTTLSFNLPTNFVRWIDYPLQFSWASLVAQLVKNLPVMRETWVRSLGLEDPLEKGKATHSSILAWRIPWTEEPGGLHSLQSSVHSSAEQIQKASMQGAGLGGHNEICPQGAHCLGAGEKGQPVRKQRVCAKLHPNPMSWLA